MDVEVLVESEDGGEALLADGADERLGAVGKPAMLHHLRTRRERFKLNTIVVVLIQFSDANTLYVQHSTLHSFIIHRSFIIHTLFIIRCSQLIIQI